MMPPGVPPTALADALGAPLPGVNGGRRSLESLLGHEATVVVFLGNGCPTVRAYEERLMTMRESLQPRGVNVIAINSNNPYLSPPDTVAELAKRARTRRFNFPYLKDPDGSVARGFGALCTPHAFLLDHQGSIVYSGRIDDSRLGTNITRHELLDAIDDLLAGRTVALSHTEPFGCSIIW